jgi:serine protease Do
VLSEVVSSFTPKEEVTITFKREGKEKKVKAVLGERKISKARIFTFRGPQGDVRSFSIPRMPQAPYMNGENLRELENLSRGLNNDFAPFEQMEENFNFPKQKKLGLKIQDTEEGGNVKVIAVEDSSAAALAGLQKDDLIEEINGKKIDNTDDAREELVPEEGKKSYKMKIIRNKQEMNIDVKIPRKLKTANL